MLNDALIMAAPMRGVRGEAMLRELLLAAFIIAVGLCVAGAGTHFYQLLLKQNATLRYDGNTVFHSLGNLAVSFFCGPYIMLQMGWRQDGNGTLSVSSALISAFVAFGWAFITGLILLGGYFALAP